jgi:diguanylate cyclase (GGDEF)-like protein
MNKDVQDDLRGRVSALLLKRTDIIAGDMATLFPFSGDDRLDAEYCRRIGHLLVQLLASGVRDGRLDARGACVGDLRRAAVERALPVDRVFTFAYLTERTALDELALDPDIGAPSEMWPLGTQLVRRASFDLLGAYSERVQLEPTSAAIVDRLTTLYTRPVFDAALAKVLDRASRFGDQVSLILFDVDRLTDINATYGYGVGDRVLERLGILVHRFFRHHDWVARYSEDSIGVVLSRTDAADAATLAERVVGTVQERLEFHDHLTELPVPLTLSAAVVNLAATVGEPIDLEQLLAETEAALARAKAAGGNSVERVDLPTGN